MKRLFIIILYTLIPCLACSQAPAIKIWDTNAGGLQDDIPTCFLETADGGFIIGGYSYSGSGGDKSEPGRGAADYWVVRIDAFGNRLWDKTFGGSGNDFMHCITGTNGGYILGGMSASSQSGDRSQLTWGNHDFWVVKIDDSGNKIWDRSYGGSSSDQLQVVVETNDNGFLLGGTSASGIGGLKTQDARGATDYWIVRTDASGNVLWDKTFGGTDADRLYAIRKDGAGGFLLGGASWSMAGADKSHDSWGLDDFWVVRIDSTGNKIWDRDYGGMDSDILYSIASAGTGFLLAGRSGSDIGGNKTQPLWGGYDYWVARIDLSGNVQWDRSVGGTMNEDEFGNASVTSDHGFLLAGTSYSSVGGYKTENNLGVEQSWFLKLDSSGTKHWDKTVFTPCHDEIGLAIETSGSCYAVVNANGPSCAHGGYRTETSWNNSRDFWIAKFCDSLTVLPVAATAASQQLCPGTCAQFVNLSVNSSSWQWIFPGANPDTSSGMNPAVCYNAPGTYDVTLVANNAYGSDTLLLQDYITVHAFPPPQSVAQNGDTLFANAGSETYQWYLNGVLIPGATQFSYISSVSGDYNVICIDSNGCEAEAVLYNVIAGIGKDHRGNNYRIRLFPDPAVSVISIILTGDNNFSAGQFRKLVVRNVMGKMIQEISFQMKYSLDVSALSPGFYYVELLSPQTSLRAKFQKQ